MAKRRELKSVAHNFLDHFVSRNNDINGWWGMGVLYKWCVDHEVNETQINLLSRSNGFSSHYHKRFAKILRSYEIPSTYVKAAILNLEFDQKTDDIISVALDKMIECGRTSFGSPTTHTAMLAYLGEAYTCKIIIETDLNHEFTKQIQGRCRVHNPERERRRAGY